MKPLWVLALWFGLFVLVLASRNTEAQVEACEEGSRPDWWSEAENHVWDQTCIGEVANLSKDLELHLESPSCSLIPDRLISWRFLQAILSTKRFREAVTQRGLRITGACFPDNIDLENEHLTWPFELKYSRFENELNMIGLQADRTVSFEGSRLKEVNLWKAQIKGRFEINHATVEGKLNMGSASIEGSLIMQGAACEEVNLLEVEVGGQLFMDDATVTGNLNMNSASTGSHLLMRRFSQGDTENTNAKIDLKGAQIGGQLNMDGAMVKGNLDMNSISIGSHLLMRHNATFDNQVILRFATIGLQLALEGATFTTLELRGATVERDLLLSKGDKSVQWMSGGEAHEIQLDCNACVCHPGRRNKAREIHEIQLDLRNTKVGTLTASHESWPPNLELYGFTYKQLGILGNDVEMYEQPAGKFINWLCRDKTFSLQPYQQLATVLRAAGKSVGADAVLFAGKNRERRDPGTTWGRYIWLTVVQVVIGHGIGIHTFHVLIWVGYFVLTGARCLWTTDECRKHLNTFHECLWFSLDYFLPAIRLREAHYEKVDLSRGARNYFYFHQLIGYILMFFVIAGLTGMAQ